MLASIAENLTTYWIVYALLAAYSVLLVRHAVHGNRETAGVADYYVGGRSMGPVVIGLSFFATYSSTNSFVGFSGQAYDWGVNWFLLIPFVVGMSFLAWVLVAPKLRVLTEQMDSLTIPDFIGFRFNSTAARVAAAVIVVFASLFYMTAVFKGIGNLLEIFLEIPYKVSIILVFLIVMAYTVVGGFISVVKTDAVQGVLMIGAAVLLFWGTFSAAGGMSAFGELRASVDTAGLFVWGGGVTVPFVLGVLFASTVKFLVEPRQLSRFYALSGPGAVKRGVIVSTLAFALVYSLLTPVGLLARRVLPGGLADTDLVVPGLLAADGVFGPGTAAFLLVAMIAAAMSSLDSVLLVLASSVQRDIVGILWKKERSEASVLRSTRFLVAFFAAITATIALNPPGGIVSLTALSGAVYGACFGPAILLGLHWKRGDGYAALGSFAVGIVTLLLWRTTPWADAMHQVFPAVVLSFVAYVALALIRPPYDPFAVFADSEEGG